MLKKGIFVSDGNNEILVMNTYKSYRGTIIYHGYSKKYRKFMCIKDKDVKMIGHIKN